MSQGLGILRFLPIAFFCNFESRAPKAQFCASLRRGLKFFSLRLCGISRAINSSFNSQFKAILALFPI